MSWRAIKIPVAADELNAFIAIKDDQISDLFAGTPKTVYLNTTLKNISAKNDYPLDVKIKTPWLDFIRIVTAQDNNIIVKDSLVIKKSIIPNKELKSKEFLKLKEDIEKHVKSASLIFSKSK